LQVPPSEGEGGKLGMYETKGHFCEKKGGGERGKPDLKKPQQVVVWGGKKGKKESATRKGGGENR